MRIVIADEGGHLGRKLALAWARRGAEVLCIVPRLHDSHASDPKLHFASRESLASWYFPGSSLAYFLSSADEFSGEGDDSGAGRNFSARLRDCGVHRLVHVEALSDRADQLSAASPVFAEIVTRVRSSAIIGEGSLPFEMIRYLVERLPVIPCASWLMAPLQPVAVSDLVNYLVEAADFGPGERTISGPSVETYSTMMAEYARARSLRRAMLPGRIPEWLWLAIASAATSLTRSQLLAIADGAILADRSGENLHVSPTSCHQAIRRALEDKELPQIRARLEPEARRTRHVIVRRQGFRIGQWQSLIPAPPAVTFAVIEAIGGRRGWLFADDLWQIRGVIDRMVGGPGMSRPRRDPMTLEQGDVVDFWRVEAIERGRLLRFRAEMKMPGDAWLQFECLQNGGSTLLRQTIFYEPRGVSGELYWASMYAFHLLLFDGLHQAIAAEARRYWNAQPDPERLVRVPEADASRKKGGAPSGRAAPKAVHP